MTALDHSQAGRLGAIRSTQVRRAIADEGLAFARRWKTERRPVAYTGPYPIKDAPTCADWG